MANAQEIAQGVIDNFVGRVDAVTPEGALGVLQSPFIEAANLWKGQNASYNPKNANSIVFPHSLSAAANAGQSRAPIVRFTCCDNRSGLNNFLNICLPIPMGISVADSARYDGIDLGLAGKIAMDAVTAGKSFADTMKQIVGSTASKATYGTVLNAASKFPIVGGAAAGIAHAGYQAVNKHGVTTFGGIGTRGYSYTFKLVASSAEESLTIKRIQDVFRLGLYPDASAAFLNAPPRWEIHFIDLKTQLDVDFIPKIYQCYLRELSVTSNASSVMWRTDNAPLEVDIMLSFTETKALTVQDIIALEKGGYKPSLDSDPLRPFARDVTAGSTAPSTSVARVSTPSTNGTYGPTGAPTLSDDKQRAIDAAVNGGVDAAIRDNSDVPVVLP